jgi:hypothetical protein
MIDLPNELADAVCNLPLTTIDWLLSFDIPESVIFGEPLMLGVANVQIFDSGFYEPNDDGDPAVILAQGWPNSPIWDTLDDLIAFKPQEPNHWWCRRGEVQLLGAYNIRPEPVFPLSVRETPLSWLRGGGRGVCVLDWAFDPERLVYAGPLEVESAALKQRLEARIKEVALRKFEISVACSQVPNAA